MCYIAHQWFIWTTRSLSFRMYFYMAPRRFHNIRIICFTFVTGVKHTSWCLLRPWYKDLQVLLEIIIIINMKKNQWWRLRPDLQKDKKFTQTWFVPKIFYPKKCVNYDKSTLQQNSIKAQKTQIVKKKMPKRYLKFQNVPKNATKKRKMALLLTFPKKTT